jgi:signal transduction histidine kinase
MRASGWIATVAVASPLAVAVLNQPEIMRKPSVAWWFAVYAVFVGAWLVMGAARGFTKRVVTLAVLSLTALVLNWLVPMALGGVALGGALLVIVAGTLPALFSRRVSVAWAVAQSLLLGLVYGSMWPWNIAGVAAGAYLGLQLFAVFAASIAFSEHAARLELSQTVAQLRGTQELLTQSTKVAERARIAHELHDVVGHHLSALGLTLEAAGTQLHRGGAAKGLELVRRAHALSSLLQAEIRSVIHEEVGAGAAVDVRGALAALADGAVGLQVQVDVGEGAERLGPEEAHMVFRGMQEFITNSRKHSDARTVRASLRVLDGSLILRMTDDGSGKSEVREGVGLGGMRQRVEELGGHLTVDGRTGNGFSVAAVWPRGGSVV